MIGRVYFLVCFALVLGLNSAAQGEAIEVNNFSFEYDVNGVQITENTYIGNLKGWTVRDTTGWGAGWWYVNDEWEHGEGFVAPDGNAAIFNVTSGDPCDPEESGECQIYQVFEDADAIVAANRRYTLTFNAIRLGTLYTPIAYGVLFYSTGEGEANEVTVAAEYRVLTALPWTSVGYTGWEELKCTYISLPGDGSIGWPLGVKLSNPYPWYEGYHTVMDNVHVDWVWASDAWDPSPADGERDVPRSVTLGWRPGLWPDDVNGHEVYLGTSWAEVNDATTSTSGVYQGASDVNHYDVSGLELGRTYYWRVDEVNEAYGGTNPPPPPDGRWKGEIWSFQATGYATNPNPANGAKGVPLGSLLSWSPGTDSNSHDVYFGDSESGVTDANTLSSEYMDRQSKDANEFEPALQISTTYYWRIDEINETAGTLLKGDIWRFTTGSYVVVEDFDSYIDTGELWDVWDDYWVNGTGSEIYIEKEADLVHDGNSLEYLYDSTMDKVAGKWLGSRIDADTDNLEIGRDWVGAGGKALVLWFYGQPGNSATENDKMWVQLDDTSSNTGVVIYDGDANDVTEAEWHEWNIDLAAFDACGVVLWSVDKVHIGFGGEQGEQAKVGGTGTVYFDDMEVWPTRCRPELAYPYGDLTEDCVISGPDLDAFTGDWLKRGQWVSAGPPASDPEVWYRFDDGPGSTIIENDGLWGSGYDIAISSPNEFDEPGWTSDTAPALDACDPNYALNFDGMAYNQGGDYLEIPNSPTDKFVGTENMTIAMWIKPTVAMGADDWPSLVESRRRVEDVSEASGFGFAYYGELIYWWNDVYWEWSSGLFPEVGAWSFVAVGVEPTQATMYLSDGVDVEYATHTATHGPLTDWETGWTNMIAGNTVYATPHGYFNGKIDDVRLYNKTLTLGEIMGLYGIEGMVYLPLESDADLVIGEKNPSDPCAPIDDQVDFRDYDVLADNWLKQYLWP
ncbi:MAG: hypothetical protein JSW23_11995 [Planctomycetota bacterium]|nr:MAG: hypothetical protein JSW23_11995 [Planctomycetota bacterium]